MVITSALLSRLDNSRKSTHVSQKIEETFYRVVHLLNKHKVQYALAGALAYGLYAPNPRNTSDIDFISIDHERHEIRELLLSNGYYVFDHQLDNLYQFSVKDPKTRVTIDILFGVYDPLLSAVMDVNKTVMFKTPVFLIKPEYLLWMYCISDINKHATDAVRLIRGGKVDTEKLKAWMEYAEDDSTAIVKLRRYIMEAKKPDPTFEETMLKRESKKSARTPTYLKTQAQES